MIEPWWLWLPIIAALILMVSVFKTNAAPDGPPPPPPEKPPPESEVNVAIAELRVALDRLQATLEKQHDHHADELRDIKRTLDRIESSRRIEESDRRLDDLVRAIARQQKET